MKEILKKFLLNLITVSFLTVTVIPQNITAANIVENFKSVNKKHITDYLKTVENIPEQYGKLFETNITKNEKPEIILIYDRHCLPFVQKNIYSLINYFSSCFDTDKIFIEGAPKGKLDISAIKDMSSDIKIKEKIFSEMLNKGLLSGTEFYSYLSDKDNLYGTEDFNLYISAVKQYADILKKQKKFLKAVKKAKKDLKSIEKYVHNKDTVLFEYIFFTDIEYDRETYEKINDLFKRKNIDIEQDYPDFYKYLKIKEYEKINKHYRYAKDFKNLLDIARSRLPASIYVKLVEKIKNRSAEQNLITIYTNTKQFLYPKQEKEYKYIEKLQKKNVILKDFKVKNFLKDKNSLYDNLSKKIFTTDFLKNIIFSKEVLYLLSDYVQLRIDYENLNKLSTKTEEFKNILLKTDIFKNKEDLIKILDDGKLDNYYKNNLTRNEIFVKNINKTLKKGTVNILVVGGFHKEITDLFNKQNIKYLSVLPNSYAGDYKIYNKVMQSIAAFYNALADVPLVLGISKLKTEEFLISWINELKDQGLNDKQIIGIINSWAKKHNEFFKPDERKQDTEEDFEEITEEPAEQTTHQKAPYIDEEENIIDVSEIVLKQNKFSLKGRLLKIKDFFDNFKTVFTFKYTKQDGDRDIDLDEKTIKKIERNIRHFPIIQIMLASELFESFAMVFMQSSGFGLPFISAVIAVLPFTSFIISGMGTFIGHKIPKKVLIAASLVIHTMGTVSFALSGATGLPILLIIAQVFPTIGVAALGLALKPFLYEQLEILGKEKAFDQIYGTNRSLFWFAMSLSSLFGSILAALVSQVFVVGIATIPDIVITSLTIITFLSTRNIKTGKNIDTENIKLDERKIVKTEEKQVKTLKERFINFFEPVTNLSKDKKALSFAAVNIIVNNIFFVVLGFFFQTSLETTGLNIAFFGAIYFAADIMHGFASNLINKIRFLVENKIVRNIIFITMTGLFVMFTITGHPLALILIFIAMNFWQGAAELTEDSAVYKALDSDKHVRWNAFRTMFGTIIGFISQISITGLLLVGIPNNALVAGSLGILTIGSFIISQIFDKGSAPKNEVSDDNGELSVIPDIAEELEINTDRVKELLSAA